MRSVKLAVVALSISLAHMPSSQAKPDKLNNWFGHLAAGYTSVIGDSRDLIEDGTTFQAGGTYWPDEWPLGVQLELGYDNFDIQESALDDRLTNDLYIWRAGVSPIWSTTRKGAVSFHVIGGLGLSRVKGRLQTTRVSWNAGVGLDVELSGGSELFLEARYQRVESGEPIEYVPVVIGFRW